MAAQIAALRDLTNEKFEGRDTALKLALDELKIRLHEMNEWRRLLESSLDRYLARPDYEMAHIDLVRRISAVETTQASWTGSVRMLGILTVVIPALLTWALSGFKGIPH